MLLFHLTINHNCGLSLLFTRHHRNLQDYRQDQMRQNKATNHSRWVWLKKESSLYSNLPNPNSSVWWGICGGMWLVGIHVVPVYFWLYCICKKLQEAFELQLVPPAGQWFNMCFQFHIITVKLLESSFQNGYGHQNPLSWSEKKSKLSASHRDLCWAVNSHSSRCILKSHQGLEKTEVLLSWSWQVDRKYSIWGC